MEDRATQGTEGISAQHRDDLDAIAVHADRVAFARLFEFYAPRLLGFFRKRGLEKNPAEDLVQDVMLTVWKKAKLYKPEAAAPSTWIYTIARNRYVDLVRKERFVEPLASHAEGAVDSPEDALETAQLTQRVEAALADIPEEQAYVIREAYLSDKSFSRIAADRALPLGTIKTRARLAIEKLRAVLGGAE